MVASVASGPTCPGGPVHRMLLAALAGRASLVDADDLDSIDFPWSEAMNAALRNRVASFVASLLDSEPLVSRVPGPVRSEWRALRMLHVFRAEAAVEQVRATASALAEVGVVPLLYKGLDFQERLYDASCPRAFSDLDLVVPASEVEAAAAALRAAGYASNSGGRPLWFQRRFHLHAVFLHTRYQRPLELHWALDSPYADLADPLPQILRAAGVCDAFGPNVLRPASVDALALMAIHLEKHIGLCATLCHPGARLASVVEAGGLGWVFDVLRWMSTQPEALREAETRGRIECLHAERALALSLRLAADIAPAALPEWARSLGERLPGRPSLLGRLVYPDLAQGLEATERGRRRRRGLLRIHAGMGFRWIRALEAVLPRPTVPGVASSWRSSWPIRAFRNLSLIGMELLALGGLRLCQTSARRRRAVASKHVLA